MASFRETWSSIERVGIRRLVTAEPHRLTYKMVFRHGEDLSMLRV